MDTALGVAVAAERRRRRGAVLLALLAVGLAAAFLLAVGQGAVEIAPGQVLAILGAQVGLDLPWAYDSTQEVVLLAIRLPRACLALLAGAALAVCGATMQGLFRNPLADPGLIGVSTGAAVAAASAIVFGGTLAVVVPFVPVAHLIPVAAFGGALAATFVVYRIASRDGRTDIATMLLAGVAINAIAAAGIGLLVFVSDDQELRDLNFWMLGSLSGITWARLLPAMLPILVTVLATIVFTRHLDALLLGETEALHLGFDVERVKRMLIVLVALAVGATVALSGVIGFVGLVVPHLVRLAIGPEHRTLLPASILLGATLLLVADLLARSLVLPAELPVGILTACVGGPFFLWLLVRRRGVALW